MDNLELNKTNHSLTQRAGLTFFSQILQQIARLIVGFAVTPVVIRGLGAELYGAWTMIQQSVGYLSLSDLRPMNTLKFTLAASQHIDDKEEKRRQIGSVLLTWVFTIPFLFILGGLAVWKLPLFIRISPDYIDQVRLSIAIVVLSVVMDRLFSLPATVLQGVNLEYKAMGLNALVILVNGFIVLSAIWLGLGLPGVAGASISGLVIAGLVRLFVARKSVLWFGVSKPGKKELLNFIKLSAWFTFLVISNMLLSASDLLLIGFVLGPESAAVYSITGAALKMTTEPFIQFFRSASSGLFGICGQKDWQRVIKVRIESFVLGLGGMIFLGAGILCLNKSFVSLWVGEKYFGGQTVNLFLVLASIIRFFFVIDHIICNGMFEVKKMAVSLFINGIFVILLGYKLTAAWGLPGMACATAMGYLSQWVYFQFIIETKSELSIRPFFILFIKLICLSTVILSISYLSFYFITINGWIEFALFSILAGVIILFYIWFIFLNSDYRNIIAFRLKSLNVRSA